MRAPGATTSGLITMSYRVGPRELNGATVSSDRAAVPCVSSAPTVSTDGSLPGDVTPPNTILPSVVLPTFPADATTTMPAATARSAASHKRIVPVRLQHRRADREVDHADVVLRPVLDRPVDRLDDAAHRARAFVVEHAQVHEKGAGGHSLNVTRVRRLRRPGRR